MRYFRILFFHELRSILLSSAYYVAAFLFMALSALLYYLALMQMADQPRDYPLTTLYFSVFWLPTLFIVPLITMRSFAEEKRLGTLEILMVTPIMTWQVVFAKFFATYLFYLLLWFMTLFYAFITFKLIGKDALDAGIFEMASLVGGYGFVAITGLLYISIGIFASCLSRSQLVSGMLSFGMLFVAILAGRIIGELSLPNAVMGLVKSPLGDYLNTFQHLEDFTYGIVDSRVLVIYGTTSLLFLGLTTILTESG